MIQLGTRWHFGDEPPENLGADFAERLREAEAEIRETGLDDGEPEDSSWTLTWLEGRPFATLDVETVVLESYAVTRDATGAAVVVVSVPSEKDLGDDW